MQFDVSSVVRIFVSLGVLVVVAGAVAVGVGLVASGMPRKRKMALVNLVFACVMIVGAIFVIL